VTRVCCRCKVEKSLDEFGRDVYKPLGRCRKCFTCVRETSKASYVKRREAKYAVKRRGVAINPEKARAHHAVEYAIKRGDLARQPCQVCGDPKTDAHHEDYAKPLEVDWLCRKHHVERHLSKSEHV